MNSQSEREGDFDLFQIIKKPTKKKILNLELNYIF